MKYDLIGDVHGYFGPLTVLLAALGYRVRDGACRHPEGRVAVFVGDLIDRGPAQVEVLDLVRRMRDAGSALVVMGNHEWNAIGFATPTDDGMSHLRPRVPQKLAQHRAFLAQVGCDSADHREWADWFRTLPPLLDLGGVRVAHAWWDDARIALLKAASDRDGRLDEGFLRRSFVNNTPEHHALEGVTKGLEVPLPEGHAFVDHSGVVRPEVRVRWWDEGATSLREAAIVPRDQRECVPDLPLPDGLRLGNPSPVPVFVGHYWFDGPPAPQNANTAVLDYSAGKGGPLVAYRWNGEAALDPAGFVAA